MTCRFLLTVGLVLAFACHSHADIGVVITNATGPLGHLTRAGHAGTYLSNICPDGSPVRLRLCHPGERGSVVNKYSPLSESDDYDWAVVPFDEFLNGFESPGLAPLIGTRQLRHAIQTHSFASVYGGALNNAENGQLPKGEWRNTLATRFDRTVYVVSIRTTVADDRAIVDTFNAAQNKSRFNHEVVSPFRILEAFKDFISPVAAQLTREQERLRDAQDDVRRAMESARLHGGARFVELAQVNATVFERLSDIRQDKLTEVSRILGSTRQWREFDREFRTTVSHVGRQERLPAELKGLFRTFLANGDLSRELLRYLDANGEFFVDVPGRGPWIRLRLFRPDAVSTGLSESHILAGDPDVALLVLTAVIDYHLSESELRREDMAYMNRLFALFRQAAAPPDGLRGPAVP